MIMDMQRNKAKLQGQVPNLTPQTNLHKQLMTQAQDIYTISEDKVMNQNKVTFKNKQDMDEESRAGTNHSKKRKEEDDGDQNKGSRMLKTEEIREICEKH